MSCSSSSTREEKDGKSMVEVLTVKNECRSHCKSQDLSTEKDEPKDAETLDLLLDFVSSLMERNYCKSLQLCKEVIGREPWNKLALRFFDLLSKKFTEDSKKGRKLRGSDSDSDSGSSTSSRSSNSSSSKSNSEGSDCDDSNDSESETESDDSVDDGVS